MLKVAIYKMLTTGEFDQICIFEHSQISFFQLCKYRIPYLKYLILLHSTPSNKCSALCIAYSQVAQRKGEVINAGAVQHDLRRTDYFCTVKSIQHSASPRWTRARGQSLFLYNRWKELENMKSFSMKDSDEPAFVFVTDSLCAFKLVN